MYIHVVVIQWVSCDLLSGIVKPVIIDWVGCMYISVQLASCTCTCIT